MAAPVYNTDLTLIDAADATTNWTAIGTGAISLETDYFIQNTGCISKVGWVAATRGMIANAGAGKTLTTPAAYLAWVEYHNPNLLDLYANGGIQLIIGSSTSAYDQWYVGGSNTIPLGGWHCFAMDPSIARDNRTSTPSGTYQYFGVLCKVLGSGSLKGNPLGVDVVRFGRELQLTAGDLANGYATISGAETTANSIANRWGLLFSREGAYYCQGATVFGMGSVTTASRARSGSNVATIVTGTAHKLSSGMVVNVSGLGGTGYNQTGVTITVTNTTTFTYPNTGSSEGTTADTGGTIATPVDFRDADRVLFILDTPKCAAGFNEFEIRGSTSRVDWTRFVVQSLGTTSPGKFTVTDNATVNLTGCTFNSMNTFALQSNTTVTSSVFNACGQITAVSGKILSSQVNRSTVAANTSALVWNTAVDPNGYLDGTSFTRGATLNHAIEFGTSSPTTMTLTGVTFSGYNAGNNVDDSAIHVKRTTGTVRIYISGGTSPSYRSDGATVDIVANPVDAIVNTVDVNGTAISDVRILLKAKDGTGPMPYDATVTIANSGTTATVTHTGHNMATNDKVQILGASLYQNNGVFSITYVSSSSYTYILPSAPGSSPTGTIKATYVAIEGTTISGTLSMSRVFTSSQPVTGWARKASPAYKTSTISGTIDSGNGFSATVVMISDV